MPDCASCGLFELESEHDGCLHVNRPGGLEVTQAALAACNLATGSSILDAACGTGTTLRYLNEVGFNALGLDLSAKMLPIGTGLPVIQSKCSQVPLPSGSQDAVLMECALSLAEESTNTLSEFFRLLRPGGWLVITDIYIRELRDSSALACLSGSACLSGVQTAESIRHNIKTAGFTLNTWQDQTALFKQWMARMVFKLGSLSAVYQQLASCEAGSQSLACSLGSDIKLGYYWLDAQKMV